MFSDFVFEFIIIARMCSLYKSIDKNCGIECHVSLAYHRHSVSKRKTRLFFIKYRREPVKSSLVPNQVGEKRTFACAFEFFFAILYPD